MTLHTPRPLSPAASSRAGFTLIELLIVIAILGLLAASERSVSDLEQQLGMAQPSVSKHLRVLRMSHPRCTGAGLAALRDFPALELLDVFGVPYRRSLQADCFIVTNGKLTAVCVAVRG